MSKLHKILLFPAVFIGLSILILQAASFPNLDINHSFSLQIIPNVLASQEPEASIYLEATPGTVNNGEELTVEVRTDTDGAEVNAVEAHLEYNSEHLEFIEIDSSDSAFEIKANEENSDGVVKIARGAIETVSGDALISKVKFQPAGICSNTNTSLTVNKSESSVVRESDNVNILKTTAGSQHSLQVLVHPDGTLVQKKGQAKIFLVKDCQLKHVASREVFESHGFQWSHVREAIPATIKLPETDPLQFRAGTLIQGSGDPIYFIGYEAGTIQKQHITSRSGFEALGLSFDNVINVSDSQLPEKDGDNIGKGSLHPEGSLVREEGDPKVYLIDEGTRRHIATRSMFESHGYSFNEVGIATQATMDLPEGDKVQFRAGTLVQGSEAPVYVIDYEDGQIQKRHIASRSAFETLDYSFGDVLDIPESQLPDSDGAAIE